GVDPGQGDPRPADASAGPRVSRLRLRRQQGIPLSAAQDRPGRIRTDVDPSTQLGVHGPPTLGRRTALCRPRPPGIALLDPAVRGGYGRVMSYTSPSVPGWWHRTWPVVALGVLSIVMWVGRIRNIVGDDDLAGFGRVF